MIQTDNPIDTLILKASEAVRDEDCCGATCQGEHVFCDDQRLSNPQQICPCKSIGRAAALAVIQTLVQLEPTEAQLEAAFAVCSRDDAWCVEDSDDFMRGVRAWLGVIVK